MTKNRPLSHYPLSHYKIIFYLQDILGIYRINYMIASHVINLATYDAY